MNCDSISILHIRRTLLTHEFTLPDALHHSEH
jgi:hypothetical protein